MRYAVIGYGKMGRAIERHAALRGHDKVAALDSTTGGGLGHPSFDLRALSTAEVAFEFTVPAAAERNVVALLRAGIPVVCGTTGWSGGETVHRAAEAGNVAAVIAPNFSVGVHLFARIVRYAATLVGGAGLHRPWLLESHHTGKRDTPSGTATWLAELVREADGRIDAIVTGNPSADGLPQRALQIASVRAAHEPGTHVVGYDGEHDRITLTHAARNRDAFALGAIFAAEWVLGRTGVHGYEPVMDALLAIAQSGGTGGDEEAR